MTDYPQETTPSVVYTDPRLVDPNGDRRWMLDEAMIPQDKEGMPFPYFRTRHVAAFFFGRKNSWLYFMFAPRKFSGYDEQGHEIRERITSLMVLDGEELVFRTDKQGRFYSLADIERMTHSLAQQRRIDGATAQRALLMVKTCAQQAGILA